MLTQIERVYVLEAIDDKIGRLTENRRELTQDETTREWRAEYVAIYNREIRALYRARKKLGGA